MSETYRDTARLTGVNINDLSERERNVFERQQKKWGEPLVNHTIYARCPEIFHGAQGMWRGLGASGLLEGQLTAILNRRVALLNGCVF